MARGVLCGPLHIKESGILNEDKDYGFFLRSYSSIEIFNFSNGKAGEVKKPS